jgi:isopenicillin N synthase-like dioxygenase
MPSPFDHIPPFPTNLTLAPIAIVSYHKLLRGDRDEAEHVLEAVKTYGFFYLDLRGTPEGETLLAESEQLHAVAKDAFDVPTDEKLQYALQRGVSLFGYKPTGRVKTTDKDQRPDTTEFLNISKDHLHNIPGTESRSYPPLINHHRPLLQAFTKHGHECGMVVLQTLAKELGLAPDEFTNLNLFDQPSGDHCRLTRKAPHSSDTNPLAVGLQSHTDFGSVTILFNWLGGLQIESRTEGRTGEWEWVKPIPGHAVINLGTVSPLSLALALSLTATPSTHKDELQVNITAAL